MWKCPQCHESVRDSFEVCWNCGTSKDGVRDPDFSALKEQTRESESDEADAASYSEPVVLEELDKKQTLDSATILVDGFALGGWVGGLLAAFGLAWIFRPRSERRSEPCDAERSRDSDSAD